MEYLTRLLMSSTSAMEFKFHPLCSSMRLSHLMFADDLLLFSKGDAPSMMTIIRTFSTFSATSGLKMSKGKSNAYFNGVNENLKAYFLQVSDKIVARIRTLGARKLSYAGRNFLWDGGVEFMRSPLVAWDKVCRPKSEGGLGLKQDLLWNKAAVGKLVWWIYTKPELLWVKWVKEVLHQANQQLNWATSGSGYTISKGYELIRNKSPDVPWSVCVWNA
ncbi:uncharacterized protein LOC141618194 [Silene latifolia]|uniref:uncharacterized protein LOC141618194 n=1 Tax=Silene latifolia TaxID=37657 RepID=UPI003D76A59C